MREAGASAPMLLQARGGCRCTQAERPPGLVPAASPGGSLLTTARADYLLPSENNAHRDRLEDMARQINYDGYDILYVIGGEGSMRAAHALWTVYHSIVVLGKLVPTEGIFWKTVVKAAELLLSRASYGAVQGRTPQQRIVSSNASAHA
jgi:hypothetical protein